MTLSIKDEFSQFCQASSIHGVQYIKPESGHKIKIAIWSAILCFCFVAAGIFVVNLVDSWQGNPIVTTIATTSMPVQEIPFPSVTICSDGFDQFAFAQK